MAGLTGYIDDASRLQRLRLVVKGIGSAPLAFDLAQGDAGTEQTLGAMKAIARHAAMTPRVQTIGRAIIDAARRLRNTDAAQLWHAMNEMMTFQRDPPRIEELNYPTEYLSGLTSRRLGDCDDRATLGASLALAMGLVPEFVVMGTRADGPFEHVYLRVVNPDGSTFAIDPQETETPGAEVPAARKKYCRV